MSSYLVAYVICDFEKTEAVTIPDRNITVSFCGRRESSCQAGTLRTVESLYDFTSLRSLSVYLSVCLEAVLPL